MKKDREKSEDFGFYSDISKEPEEKIEDFILSIGEAFDIEVSKEALSEGETEKLLNEEDLEELIPDWEDEEPEDYETPELMELMVTGKGVCKGTIDDRELEELLDYLREELDKSLAGFYEIEKSLGVVSFTEREMLVRIERAFSLYEEALEEMAGYFSDKDIDHILEGLDMAQTAVNRLYKSFIILNDEAKEEEGEDFLEDFLEEKIKILERAWERRISKIPSDDNNFYDLVITDNDDEDDEEYYTNPNFEKLMLDVELFKEGKINEEKFFSALTCMEDNIEAGREDIKEIDRASLSEKDCPESLIISALDAFSLYEKGLLEMKKFFSDKAVHHLDKGLDMAFEATQVIARIEIFFE